MEYRAPSSLATTAAGLRRRSGVYAQDHEEEEDELDTSETALQPHSTVLLVRRALYSPPLPALPSFLSRSPSPLLPKSAFSPAHTTEPDGPLSPIPLTPRLDEPQRGHFDASFQSACTASIIPPSPMPDFTQPPYLLSLLPRGLGFYPPPRPACPRASSSDSQLADTETARSRPLSLRSDSQGSSSAGSTDSGSNSVDSGHRALIKSIGTTDKFTHKWPRPQSVRTYSGDDTGDAASLGLLEDGRGLAIDGAEPWTGFKWCLLFSVCTVFVYGAAALVCALMTWFRMWDHADVMYVADNDILVLLTLASSLLVFTSLVGLSGVLLTSRPLLAAYALLLWPAFVALVAIGYVAYKRTTFALDHKLNLAWSQYYTPLGRLRVQDALRCCGFYSALHEAASSARCYPRTPLPGCKGKLYRFERAQLARVWRTVFALVPLHLLNVLAALLCANQVTQRFGRGIMPARYRLTGVDVQADAEKIMGRVKLGVSVPSERWGLADAVWGEEVNGEEDKDGEDRVPLTYDGQQLQSMYCR
ncbi:tetraspanin Tsp2 family [Mycena vitilis]|nr:tetraspanin Tsp2 family [Mycena vitilis]